MKSVPYRSLCIVFVLFFLLAATLQSRADVPFIFAEDWSIDEPTNLSFQVFYIDSETGEYKNCSTIDTAGVILPNGTRKTIRPTMSLINLANGGQIQGYTFTFTPTLEGNYIVFIDFSPVFDESLNCSLIEHVKTIIHFKERMRWNQQTS